MARPVTKLYALYDMHNNGICAGIGTARELCDNFGFNIITFRTNHYNKSKMKSRYEIIEIKEEDEECQKD